MKIRAVTSAFLSIRPDREPDYFLRPLADFLDRMGPDSPQFDFRCFLEPRDRALASERIDDHRMRSVELEAIVNEVWPESGWAERYYSTISGNPTHHDSFQARYDRLIAVYLGKLALMRMGFDEGADAVLWFDSGHWVSHQCAHDIGRYTPSLMDDVDGQRAHRALTIAAAELGIVGTRCYDGKKRFHMPLEHMYAYLTEFGHPLDMPPPFYQAVFWLVRRDRFDEFFCGFQGWWRRLMADGKAGTEESALTLLGWERRLACFRYARWVELLKGKVQRDPCWGKEAS